MSSENDSGLLVVISGPSGSGKSTVCRRLAERMELTLSVSATTRAPRPGEADGEDYWFMDHDTFRRRVERGEMLEHSEHFGNSYGTPRAPVEAALAEGRTVVLEIDVNGAKQVRENAWEGLRILMVFISPPSAEELQRRLKGRDGEHDAEALRRRQERVEMEMRMRPMYDAEVVNDDLDRAVAEVQSHIAQEARSHDGRCTS